MRKSLIPILFFILTLACQKSTGPFDPTYWDGPFQGITFTDASGKIIKTDPSDWCYPESGPPPSDTTSGEYTVYPAYPNPVEHEDFVTIHFYFPQSTVVSIIVQDTTMNIVRNLISEDLLPGDYHLFWDLKDNDGHTVPPGIYRCRFVSQAFNCQGDIWIK